LSERAKNQEENAEYRGKKPGTAGALPRIEFAA
jgi:hypothetical protein